MKFSFSGLVGSITALGLLLVGHVACSGSPTPVDSESNDTTNDAGDSLGNGADGGTTPGPDPGGFGTEADGGEPPTTDDSCSEESKLVYVLDYERPPSLHRFDPKTISFATVGVLNCDPSSSTFSMAVDRSGTAWVLYGNGKIYKVSTKDASCQPTSFEPNQQGYDTFGMGFATDGPNSKTERLYIGGVRTEGVWPFTSTSAHLGSIDLTSMKLSDIGKIPGFTSNAELTGTGSGQLFGFFVQGTRTLAEFDKGSAQVKSTTALPDVPSGSFAFAAWGGDFWLFVGNSVYQHQPTTKTTTKVKTVDFEMVGAGVSTCAPTEPPK